MNGNFTSKSVAVTGGWAVTFNGTIGTINNIAAASAATVAFETGAPVFLTDLTLGASATLKSSTAVTTQTLMSTGGAIDVTAFTVVGQSTLAGGHLFAGTTLTLGSSTTLSSPVTWSGHVNIVNPAGGTLEVQDGTLFSVGFGADVSTIVNAGIIRKSQGSGAAVLGLAVNNSGTIEVLSGTLSLGDFFGGSSGGIFNGLSGTTLRLAGAFLPGSQISSAGSVEFVGPTTVSGTLSAPSIAVLSGTATFDGALGPISDLTVGDVTMAANASFNNASPVTLSSLMLRNGSLSGSASLTTGALTWINSGVVSLPSLTVTGHTDASGSSVLSLENATLTLGTTTTWASNLFLFNSSLVNPAQGTLGVQSGVAISDFSSNNSSFVNAGTLNMNGDFSNLTLVNVALTTTGTLALRVGGLAPDQFDRVVTSKTAALDGTIDLMLVGGFVPASGDSFDVLTYGSRTGQFATVQGNGQTYTPVYGPTVLTLVKP